MDKRILTVILLVALFIPTFIAVGYYSSTKSEPGNVDSVSSLRIRDPDNQSWSFSSDDGKQDSKDMIDLFISMRTNASKIEQLPDAMESADYFQVTVSSAGEEFMYQYYFTTDPEDAYMKDSEGAVFKVSPDDARKFLSTQYSVCLYDSEVPFLVVGSGVQISPSAATWNFKTYDGTYKPLDTAQYVTTTETTCNIDGGFSISMTEAADYMTISITDTASGEIIYNGSIEELGSSLDLGNTTEIKVSVSAEWYQSAEKNHYGSATYTFIGKVVEKPVFYLGQTTVENGKFVCIAGKNIENPSEITFTSTPSINVTPQFYAEGGYVYTLVPISYELEDGTTQNYTFTLSYRGYSQEMNLTVTSYKYGNSTVDISKAVEELTYTDTAIKEAEDALLELAKTEALDTHMFEGAFLEDVVGANSTDKISPGFGRFLTVKSSGTQYRHTGVDYNVKKGTDVLAVNSGRVVYSGYLTMTGYIVVIDHGWGLKSWYCHLSECSVQVGANVEKGDVIGKSGESGFAAKNRTHVGLTVQDVPVCIYGYWDEGVKIPDMSA